MALYAADRVVPGSCVVVICKVEVAAFTVSVAEPLLAVPALLPTTTSNVESLSAVEVAGVV